MLTFWVAIAKAEGIAEITVSNSAGERGTVILTVGSAAPAAPEAPASGDSAGLTANLEIRQEMIWLINQTRKDYSMPPKPAPTGATHGITPWRKAKPLLTPVTPMASVTTSPCSPAQPTQPNALSTTGSTLLAISRR